MIEFIGNKEYGGWFTETNGLGNDSIVYSLGVGEDISWDRAVIEKFGCSVFAFDPTPRVAQWVASQTLPKKFLFTPVGVAACDGVISFESKVGKLDISVSKRFGSAATMIELPVKRLRTLMQERGHKHIDVLKMDIESAEYEVIPDILDLDVRQILVETHQRFFTGWKGLRKLYGMYITKRLFRMMRRAGFEIKHAQHIDAESVDCDYLFVRGSQRPYISSDSRN